MKSTRTKARSPQNSSWT